MAGSRRFIQTIILFVSAIILLSIPASIVAYFDDGWSYRRGVDVSNPCGEALTDYQVQVMLDSSFDFTRAQPDGSDLRVTDEDGETPISFWIETWDSAAETASIWVEVPAVPIEGTRIYLYYGNATATSLSDGAATFNVYDGFESNDVGSPPVAEVSGYWNKYAGNPVIAGTRTGFASAFYDSDTGIYHNFLSWGNILHYTSTDGINWTADDANNPVLVPTQAWEGSNVGVPMAWKEGDTWYMLYRGGSPDRIGLATSPDAVNWTKSAANPVLSGDPGAWDDVDLDPWGVIKVGDTYYMWYNGIGASPGLGRCTGLATSTDLVNWTKDANNPIFTGGRFCAFPFKYGDDYYLLIPHYTSGSDFSQIELYRDSNPTFYPGERQYLGVAINYGPTDWDDHDQDTPAVLTDTIYRDTFAASGNQLWVYYAGEGGDGSWQTGLVIEEDIGAALAGIQPNLLNWSITGDVSVVDDPVRQGVRAVQQHDTDGSVQLRGSFGQQERGVVSAWMRRSSTSDGDYDIYLWGGSTLSCVAGLGRDGDFHYWNGSFQPTGVNWASNTWYLVTLAFDASAQLYDFIVQDESLAELVLVEDIAFGNASAYIDAAVFYTSTGFLEDGFVDDFRLRQWCLADAGVVIGPEEEGPPAEELVVGIVGPADYEMGIVQLPPDITYTYINDIYMWFTTVPERYIGLPFIRTDQQDKRIYAEEFLTFQVNRPVVVYVCHSTQISPPAWLMDNFTLNGDQINIGGLTFDVWQREYPASEIILGANRAIGETTGPGAMYVVIIEELTGPLAPDASFMAAPRAGVAPFDVVFTDQSSREITSWLWDFGDGETSTLQNPTHTYDSLPGTYSVTLEVSGPGGTDSLTETDYITIEENLAPEITSTAITEAFQDILYSYDVEATDPNSLDTITFSLDAAPTGMQIDPVSGLITWTPAAADVGVPQNVIVRAEDDNGLFDTQEFTITVSGPLPNQPPVITSTPVTTATEGVLYNYDVEATDPNTSDTITYSLDIAPVGMVIDSVSGLIAWTPTMDQVGVSHDVRVVVQDNGDPQESVTQEFAVTVEESGDLEIAIIGPSDYELGTVQLPPDITYTYINDIYMWFTAAPEHYIGLPFIRTAQRDKRVYAEEFLTFQVDRPVVVYVCHSTQISPPAWLIDNFSLNGDQINIGGLTFDVWQREYPAGEIILGGNRAVGETTGPGAMYVVMIEALTGPLAPLASFMAAPRAGVAPFDVVFTDQSSGDITSWLWDFGDGEISTLQNPTHTYDGLPDTYSVTLEVSGPGGADSLTETDYITIEESLAPEITSTAITEAAQDILYSYDVEATDPNTSDTITFSLDAAPTGMQIDPVSGLITWTPAAADVGPQNVIVRAEDDNGLFDTQEFTITVSEPQPNLPPEITSTPITTATEGVLYNYDVEATDPNSYDTITFSLDTAPDGMVIDPASGLIAWTPTMDQIGGPHNVTVVVQDNGDPQGSDTQEFAVTVVAYFDDGWSYRRGVDVSNPCGEALTDYQVQVMLDSSFDFTRAQPDGSDLRVTDEDGETPISFWIETWDSAAETASIWVEVPAVPIEGTRIYLYYGNATATSLSDGAATFNVYDGFESNDVGSPPVAEVSGYWNKYAGNPVIAGTRTGFASAFYDSDTGIYHNFLSWGNILHYTSTDGINWTADDANNPVLVPTQAWEGSNVGVPMAWKEGDTWYMLYRGGSPDRIGLATSPDAVNWTKSAANPVLSGDPGAWDDVDLDPWGVIKVGDTYYMWYNGIGASPGLGRCTGLATSTDLVNWTKDANNPIFTGGRFCAFPFKYGDDYYLLIPHYTSGSDFSQIELYRDSNPTFYPGERQYLGVAINYGPTDWDDHDQDTPAVLTDTIYRDTFAASGNQLWVYYAGEGGDGSWQTGLVIEEDIGAALAGIQPNLLNWSITGDVSVVDDPVRQGVRAVQQHDTDGSVQLRGSFGQQERGVVSAWMRRSSTSDGDYDIYLWGGSTLSCVAGLGRDGDFHYWNGSFQPTGVNWASNTWYLVTLAFDASAQLYDFIVQDESLAELVLVEDIAFGNASAYIDAAVFYTSTGFLEDGFVDDFRLRQWCLADAGVVIGPEEEGPPAEELVVGIVGPADYEMGIVQLPPDITYTYINDIYMWFTTVPERYIGLPFIRTDQQDKRIYAEEFLTFQVNRPVVVYVCHSTQISPPAWLMDNFTLNGDQINIGGLTFDVWQREYPAGEIILGGNRAVGETTGPGAMYVVMIMEN